MTRTIIERVDQAFDPTLPYYTPDPLTDDVLWRLTAADLPVGPVASWATDIGALNLLQGTAAARPNVALTGEGYPSVDFDGTDDNLTTVEGGDPIAAVCTLYIVFHPHATTLGADRALVDFNGMFIQLDANGRVQARGSQTTLQTGTTPVTSRRTAVAVVINNGAVTVDYTGSVGTGSVTSGARTRVRLGAAGSAQRYKGLIFEIIACNTAHTPAQRQAQLRELRAWYVAA